RRTRPRGGFFFARALLQWRMATPQPPPYTPPAALMSQLRGHGHALLAPEAVADLCGAGLPELGALAPAWDDLPPDDYLRDGGRYRFRRHSCFVVADGAVEPVPHRAHWQSLDYNALHGGMHRWFEPVAASTVGQPAW